MSLPRPKPTILSLLVRLPSQLLWRNRGERGYLTVTVSHPNFWDKYMRMTPYINVLHCWCGTFFPPALRPLSFGEVYASLSLSSPILCTLTLPLRLHCPLRPQTSILYVPSTSPRQCIGQSHFDIPSAETYTLPPSQSPLVHFPPFYLYLTLPSFSCSFFFTDTHA